jgi:hypothetical protein
LTSALLYSRRTDFFVLAVFSFAFFGNYFPRIRERAYYRK